MKIWAGRRDQRLADLKGTLIILHLLINIGCRTSSHRKSRRRMLWFVKLSGFASLATLVVLLSPSFQSEAFREGYQSIPATGDQNLFSFRKAPSFRNAAGCQRLESEGKSPCDPSLVHVAITLDGDYLRGSMSAVHSILQHSVCPENVFFHFLVSDTLSDFGQLVATTLPSLRFKLYFFNPERIRGLISSSVRSALEQPLNYARNYLSEILEPCVRRVIYLDSDIIVVDDIAKLWRIGLGSRTVGAPEYCHANFTNYFTNGFWGDQRLSRTFKGQNPCYFNTGVMVIDLNLWRRFGYTRRIERWMEVQKSRRIYELGSLPPFLLVFAGRIEPIDHRWNQHGLGGDNVKGSCRNLHPGPVSLLHWSGSGKPWVRLDSNRPCPLDSLWAPYDLYEPSSPSSSSLLSSS